jgi:hypothetical protein
MTHLRNCLRSARGSAFDARFLITDKGVVVADLVTVALVMFVRHRLFCRRSHRGSCQFARHRAGRPIYSTTPLTIKQSAASGISAVGFEWRSGRRNQNRSPSGWKIDLFNNPPRRHDYNVDVAGGATGATMRRTSRTLMAKMAPTTRRVFARDADGQKIDECSLPPTLPRSPTCERIERCRPQGVWRTC